MLENALAASVPGTGFLTNNEVSILGKLIGQPEPSTTVPAGVFGHLSNWSATPSPSESFFRSLIAFSTLPTRPFKASTSWRSAASYNSSYIIATGFTHSKFGFDFGPKVYSKPA